MANVIKTVNCVKYGSVYMILATENSSKSFFTEPEFPFYSSLASSWKSFFNDLII